MWAAPTTTAADRKDLIRPVGARVVVEAERTREQVHVRLAWVGGGQTSGIITRPLRHGADLRSDAAIGEQVRTGTEVGLPAASIAHRLTDAG